MLITAQLAAEQREGLQHPHAYMEELPDRPPIQGFASSLDSISSRRRASRTSREPDAAASLVTIPTKQTNGSRAVLARSHEDSLSRGRMIAVLDRLTRAKIKLMEP
jgi:hypothetical protein